MNLNKWQLFLHLLKILSSDQIGIIKQVISTNPNILRSSFSVLKSYFIIRLLYKDWRRKCEIFWRISINTRA